jgi:hypothetical protein
LHHTEDKIRVEAGAELFFERTDLQHPSYMINATKVIQIKERERESRDDVVS